MMNVCGSKNDSQLYQWVKSYKKGKLHRLQQLNGKQYRVGKGPFEEKLIETFHAMPKESVRQIWLKRSVFFTVSLSVGQFQSCMCLLYVLSCRIKGWNFYLCPILFFVLCLFYSEVILFVICKVKYCTEWENNEFANCDAFILERTVKGTNIICFKHKRRSA